MSTDHAWVQFQYMPIEVEVVNDGDVAVKFSDEDLATAHEQAQEACYLCEIPLTAEAVGTECPGQPSKG